jgi:hypothetical protein
VHSACDVGLDKARMIGIYNFIYRTLLPANFNGSKRHRSKKQLDMIKNTSLNEEMASTTSCVKVCPFPDVPIRTVGLIVWNGANTFRSEAKLVNSHITANN